MKISIAFITYNRSFELRRAIDSIISQMVEGDEIVIADNGSRDEHRTAMIEYATQLSAQGVKISLQILDRNYGVAGGRNRVWKMARNPYVLFLDDDCVVADGKLLEKIRLYLSKNNNIGALAIRINEPITGGNHNSSNIFTDSVGHKLTGNFYGGAHVVNRLLFEVEKLYPDTLFWGAEEWYATLRIYGKGLQIHLLPDAEVLHYPETTNEGRVCSIKERDENGFANRFVINRLLLPSVILPATVVVSILRLFYHRMRYGIDVRIVLHYARTRYDKRFKHKIPMKAVLDYASKFGYRSLL